MKREEFKDLIFISQGTFSGKPDLYKVKVGDQTFMVKDVWGKNFLFRWTLGLWLIHKEWKIYSRLAGIEGIPKVFDRIDRFAFVMEYVPGKPINRGENLPPSFFHQLELLLREVHSRGVVHLDLRHKGNILLSGKGEPFLIDFNSSLHFEEKGLLYQFLFPLLKWVDYAGLLKLKQRVSPASMTSDELFFLRRFNWLRRFWIFN